VHVKGGERGAELAGYFAVEPDKRGFVFPHLRQNNVIEAFKAKPVVILWTHNLT
jgi:hypothetical protein